MNKSSYGTILLILVMLLLIGFRHSDWLAAPTQAYMGDTHDGFRSFMASIYHAKYDSSYLYYEGMNYPYGDRTVFSGCQQLFSNAAKFISQNVVDISDYGPVFIHSATLLSLLFCGLFLYLLFRKLKLPIVYSIAVAAGITFLSPQLDRFNGHYGLTYTLVIPCCVYLLYLFEEKRHWKYSIYIATFLLLLSQSHMYLFALALFTISLYFVYRLLFDFNRANLMWYGGQWLIQCLLPFVLLEVWINLVDFINDRPKYPYGFKVYIAHWQSIFFNHETDLGEWVQKRKPIHPFGTVEGLAWIGSAALLLIIKELIRIPVNWFRGSKWAAYESKDFRFLARFLAAAVTLLIVSFGKPFIWQAFEGLEMHIGPLRQFRSLGRFAWSFYYISNIVVFYLLWHQCKQYKQWWWKWLPLLIAVVILCNDAYFYAGKRKNKIHPIPSKRAEFKAADHPWLEQIDIERYQAMLPIPFYHVGSENIWMQAHGKFLQKSLWASVQTGLPSMGVFMTRTSLSQTLKMVELVAEPYRAPLVLKDLPNEKPILVFISNQEHGPVWYRYDHLFYGLQPIFKDKLVTLYELPIERLRMRPTERRDDFLREMNTIPLFPAGGLLSKDSLPNFVYKSFDKESTERSYRSGGFQGIGNQDNLLFEGAIPQQDKESRYVFSIWSFAKADLHMKQWLHIKEYDASGKEIKVKHFEMSKFIRSVDGEWVLIDIPFYLESSESSIRVSVDNNDLYSQSFFVDEMQIRRQDAILFKDSGEELVRNNRWFGKEGRVE